MHQREWRGVTHNQPVNIAYRKRETGALKQRWEAEEAAMSLGASRFTVFTRIILPALRPALIAGAALAFARAIGEFGSVVLISGNLPFKTEVGSVFIYNRIQSGDNAGAAAVSVTLLAASLVLLTGLGFLGRRWSR